MGVWKTILRTPNRRIVVLAVLVLALDQITKACVLSFFELGDRRVIISGFFDFVYWANTGAAWSLFSGNNILLAAVAIGALLALALARHHFDAHTVLGQFALGLIFGGIVGNLIDRLRVGHVVDFLYFYLDRRGAGELGFPAFNVADSAICTGVGLVFLMTLRSGTPAAGVDATKPEAKRSA
jgi:signal peptidase II